MSVSVHQLREKIGGEPDAVFEVARGTDTEDVEATPESVDYGVYMDGYPLPRVSLHFNKYHAFLPPWRFLVAFTLDGDAAAEFGGAEYKETRVTGDLKTVNVIARQVRLDEA